MPFVSQAQRGFLYARHPEVAERWEKHTPKGKKLPKRKGKKHSKGYWDAVRRLKSRRG